MDRPMPPCKNCADHTELCKFECERWHRYEKEKAEFDEAFKKYAKNEIDLHGMAVRRANEYKRKCRRG